MCSQFHRRHVRQKLRKNACLWLSAFVANKNSGKTYHSMLLYPLAQQCSPLNLPLMPNSATLGSLENCIWFPGTAEKVFSVQKSPKSSSAAPKTPTSNTKHNIKTLAVVIVAKNDAITVSHILHALVGFTGKTSTARKSSSVRYTCCGAGQSRKIGRRCFERCSVGIEGILPGQLPALYGGWLGVEIEVSERLVQSRQIYWVLEEAVNFIGLLLWTNGKGVNCHRLGCCKL